MCQKSKGILLKKTILFWKYVAITFYHTRTLPYFVNPIRYRLPQMQQFLDTLVLRTMWNSLPSDMNYLLLIFYRATRDKFSYTIVIYCLFLRVCIAYCVLLLQLATCINVLWLCSYDVACLCRMTMSIVLR